MAVVTWMGIFPLVLVLSGVIAPVVAPVSPVLSVALVTTLVVVLMTWVVAPWLTRALSPWLRPRAATAVPVDGESAGPIPADLPGAGTIYLGQNLRFKAPVRPGDTVKATVEVRELYAEKRRVTLSTVCTVGETVVIDGEALVMPTSRQAQ